MKAGYGIPCAVAPTLPKCNNPLPDNATAHRRRRGVPGLLYPSEVTLLKTRGAEYNAQIKTLARPRRATRCSTPRALLADIADHGTDLRRDHAHVAYLAGGVFSYDGVHPTATGYAIVADDLVQFVNANYGTSIPRVDMYPYLFNGNSSSGGFPTQLRRPADPGGDHRVRRGVLHAGGPRELLADDGRLGPRPASLVLGERRRRRSRSRRSPAPRGSRLLD